MRIADQYEGDAISYIEDMIDGKDILIHDGPLGPSRIALSFTDGVEFWSYQTTRRWTLGDNGWTEDIVQRCDGMLTEAQVIDRLCSALEDDAPISTVSRRHLADAYDSANMGHSTSRAL